jgi:dTDP-4-dehydrorhamnose 3,5-epimerase
LSDEADFLYKVSGHYYTPADEICIRWDDPDIGVQWPLEAPLVSEKDGEGIAFGEVHFS